VKRNLDVVLRDKTTFRFVIKETNHGSIARGELSNLLGDRFRS